MIAVITGLIVVIRIAEIFIDPLLGNLVDNTTTKWGRFRPWQFIGGLVSSVLIMLIFSGMFGLVNVNTTLFIVLFVITFIVQMCIRDRAATTPRRCNCCTAFRSPSK